MQQQQQQQQPYPAGTTAFYAQHPPPPPPSPLASSYGPATSVPSTSTGQPSAWQPPLLASSSTGGAGAYPSYPPAGSAMHHLQQQQQQQQQHPAASAGAHPPPQLPYGNHQQAYSHHPPPSPSHHYQHHQQQQQQPGLQPSPRHGSIKLEQPAMLPAVGSDHASTPASYDGGHQRPDSSPGTPDPSSSSNAAAAAAAEAADKKEQQKKALRRNMACHQCRRRKLKCDSLRPQCTPCSKARQSFLESLPPGMEAPEMSCLCTYDEMNGPFKKSAAVPPPRKPAAIEPKPSAKRVHEDDEDDDQGRSRRLEFVERENAKLKAQLNELNHRLAQGSPPPRDAYGRGDPSSTTPQPSNQPYLAPPQSYGSSFEGPGLHTPPYPQPLPAPQHLSASWSQAPPPPALASSSAHSLPPTLPSLLHPPPPLPRQRPDSHLHYPFLNQQQQQQFLLPPIQSPLSPSDDFSDSLRHPFDLRTGDVVSPLGNREAVIKTLGGLEELEKSIRQLCATSPLMRHVWPPFKPKYSAGGSSPVHPSSPTSTTSSSTSSPASPYTLLSRLHLPATSPMRIHVSLLLALSALVHRGTENSQVWAIEAGREIMFAKLAGISGEEESDARARERKAVDVVQAAILLIALHHFEGSWAEFHNFAPLASLMSDLLGLDPIHAPVLPEYSVSVLRRPSLADDVYEERRRTVQCAKFVHHVYLVFSARGAWDVGHEVSLRPGEELTSTPMLLNLQSIYLVSRVEKFNKTLRPPPPPLPATASLLQSIEDQVAFQLHESDIDNWCVKLGMLDPARSDVWEGEYGMGELLGGKVLAEHARLLLYCVHLNNNSNDSQRRACLAAAQSISQSCVVASSIPPLAVPSFCLHSYFLAAQILLRFLASAQLNHDDWLISQLTQQVSVIKHTFERLSGSYRVARNFHKLLETAMTEGSAVIPQSFAMVFDLAFYTPK